MLGDFVKDTSDFNNKFTALVCQNFGLRKNGGITCRKKFYLHTSLAVQWF